MNFARRIVPEQFSPPDWDHAWSLGWFRMRQTLFTTHFLCFERRIYSAVWLRVGLVSFANDKTLASLRKRNKRFRWEFNAFDGTPSETHEELFRRYRQNLPFEPAQCLTDLLGDANRFSSWQADLFDGDTLIASGVFDIGERAAAGIVSYYDPSYQKYSLGRYLILEKMEFCRSRGLEWFYPGYAVPGQPRFDYKWRLGTAALEYFDLVTDDWRFFDPEAPMPDPLRQVQDRLTDFQQGLALKGLELPLKAYLPLDINLNPHVQGEGLFDFPLFVDCLPEPGCVPNLVAVFDPRVGRYHLLRCRSVYRLEEAVDSPTTFSTDLLFIEQLLFSTDNVEELLTLFVKV
jgi:arginine-tRNA-protein transferase